MIYTVTMLKTIYGYRNPVHKYELGKRCVGYYETLKEAHIAVTENHCDIYENGYYPFCVIEGVSYGIWAMTMNEVWYQWNVEKDGYNRIKKPDSLKHTTGFGMG